MIGRLPLHILAERARLSPEYVTRILRQGNAPYATAARLAHLSGLPLTRFLFGPHRLHRHPGAGSPPRTARRRSARSRHLGSL